MGSHALRLWGYEIVKGLIISFALAMTGFFLIGYGTSQFAEMPHQWAVVAGAVLIYIAGTVE